MRRVVALAVILAARAVGAADATAPKLEPTPPAAPASDPTARRLPPTIAVCRDPGARKCWTAPTAAGCGGVDAVFRVVIAEPGRTDADDALAACRAEMAGDTR